MLLELTHVHKSYASPPVEVLRDINFQLADAEAVAIVGPSGSGKSTLLNMLGALDRPTQGTALFDGRDLAALTEPELAAIRNRQIGFIFQLHHLLPQCTVLENVLIPTLAGKPDAAARVRAGQLLTPLLSPMRCPSQKQFPISYQFSTIFTNLLGTTITFLTCLPARNDCTSA